MLSHKRLENIQSELREPAKAIVSALIDNKKENKMGLNVKHIQDVTKFSYNKVNVTLSALVSLNYVNYEHQGSSKVYKLMNNYTTSADKERLFQLIKEKSLVLSGENGFDLASGKKSTFFFDMKKVSLDPEGSNLIADWIVEYVSGNGFDSIGGLESGAIPIVASVCVKSWVHGDSILGFFVRKGGAKERGTKQLIEGNFKDNSNVILLDDVTTSGGSVLVAVDEVRSRGCKVNKVITIVDRLSGAKEKLQENEIELVHIFTKDDFGLKGLK